MYLIRLASGREASFATMQELALAIQRGDVGRDALIYHRRTDQWLPIERHPHFYAQMSSSPPDVSDLPGTFAPPAPAIPTPLAPPLAEPLRPAPTRPNPPRSAEHRAPPRAEPRGHIAPAPVPAPAPPARRRMATIGTLVVVVGAAAGLFIGWQLRPGERGSAERGGFRYAPAPAPSSLLRPDPAAEPASGSSPTPRAVDRPLPDPRVPVSAAALAERHARAFTASREQLRSELLTVGLDGVFGVRSIATPDGARAGRRIIASALNVVGQFHRREVMLDQAYRDTAAYQTTRAGWSADERKGWDRRPTLREPYAAADLAESLLADADSLLSILATAGSYELRGDTLIFRTAALSAAYRAQRGRIAERSGPPAGDPDRRPTLALVRRSVDVSLLPASAP